MGCFYWQRVSWRRQVPSLGKKPKGRRQSCWVGHNPQSHAEKTDNGEKAQALLTSQQAQNAMLKETIQALVGDLSAAQDRESRREQTYR